MNLEQALATSAPQRRNGGRCKLAAIVETFNDDERKQLEAVIDDRDNYSAPRIASTLMLLGKPISPSQVTSHRRGDCSCHIGG